MVGQPKTRERMKEAEAAADKAAKRLEQIRLNLIRAGLDPNKFDPDAPADPIALADYLPTLPTQVQRLASAGQSIEEIRVTLGFTEAQEKAWADQYVDFSVALTRVRARELAFWQGQARQLAASGDRAGFTAVSALIERRYNSDNARGDASQLVHVHIGKPLEQRVRDDD